MMIRKRSTPRFSTRYVFIAGLACVACGDDIDLGTTGYPPVTTTITTGQDTGDPTTGGEDTFSDAGGESGAGDGDGGGEALPCGYEGMLGAYDLVELPYEDHPDDYRQFTPDLDCDFEGIYDEEAGPNDLALDDEATFKVFVYHPQDEQTGEWPQGLDERPVVFFGPANGSAYHLVFDDGTEESDHRYADLFRKLVEAGFVVFGIQPDNLNMSSGHRRAALACTMLWARDEYDEAWRLSEYALVAGHSRSGGGAYLLTEDLLAGTNLPSSSSLDEWEHCGLVTFAQSFGVTGETEIDPITHRDAPPFLSILGTTDEDTKTKGVMAYDNRFSEADAVAAGAADAFDEVVLMVHGKGHGSWGGTSFGEGPIAPFYALEFAKWQMLGDDEARRHFMDLVDVDVDDCAFDNLPISDPGEWNTAQTEVYYTGCSGNPAPAICTDPDPDLELVGMGRPLIRADFGQGEDVPGARRWIVDSLDHSSDACERYDTQGPDLGTSSSEGLVTVTRGPGGDPVQQSGPCVCVDGHAALNAGSSASGVPDACEPAISTFALPNFVAHEGNGMLVRFGGSHGPATIRWSLVPENDEGGATADLSAYTHISLRIGNYVEDATGCDSGYAPDEFTVTAELEDDDGMGEHVISLGTFVESDQRQLSSCHSAQFAQTVRVPLARLCEEGMVSIGAAKAILLHFDNPSMEHTAIVDSIELTRDPAGASTIATCSQEDPPEPCPDSPGSGWNCEAKSSLDVTETSCSDAPQWNGCDPGDVDENPVDLPEVDDGQSGTFPGWVANIPKGWIQDPQNPTQDEIDDIKARCVAACELEWSDNPNVEAECEAANFETPTLRETPAIPVRARIPNADADGSGLFTRESLACDLRTDCCEQFDEDLCAARPGDRATTASAPLGRGEEWVVSLEGAMKADSSYATATAEADLVGLMGYSFCAAGNDDDPCPFYVGSFELDLTESLELELECDSQQVAHEIEALSIQLVQPAFGIQQEDTSSIGLPRGALLLDADLIIDGLHYRTVSSTEHALYLEARSNLVEIDGLTDGFVLEFSLPCNGEVADVQVWFDLESSATLESPPSVGVTVSDQYLCPATITLTANSSDPDSDLEGVRWMLDDTLIAPGTSQVQFWAPPTIFKAIARDERGATTTDTKVVSCLPV